MSAGYYCALFVAQPLIKRCGRLPSLFLMFVLLSLVLLLFGFAKYSPSNELFISLSIVARLG